MKVATRLPDAPPCGPGRGARPRAGRCGGAAVFAYLRYSVFILFALATVLLLAFGPRPAARHLILGAEFAEINNAGVEGGGGVAVVRTLPGLPAERAGLKPGDIITAVNGKTVQSREKFDGAMGSYQHPGTYTFTVQRGTETLSIPATLEEVTDRVTVQYWEKWTGDEESKMRVVVDQFNNTEGSEKKIFVELLSMTDIGQKTLVSTAAGVPPDVAGLWAGNVAQYGAINALEPLDDYVANTGIHYKKVYWDACHYDGKLYALISTPATILLVYNKALFQKDAEALRKAGCDPDRAPRTLEEFDRYAKALTIRDAQGRSSRRATFRWSRAGTSTTRSTGLGGGSMTRRRASSRSRPRKTSRRSSGSSRTRRCSAPTR